MFRKLSTTIILLILTFVSCTTSENIVERDPPQIEPPQHDVKWFDNATIYEVNIRQYTEEGTFSAFSEHLPRLKDLGVDILWIMPIYPISIEKRKGSLGSYYAVSDYTGVNPEFGTIDDFKELVDKCHAMGMTVILDWVANHTGWDNKWITEHPDWYSHEAGKIIHPTGTDWTDVADLNYDNVDMRKAMIDSMEYWVTDANIDGFRCDVAGMVPVEFWNDASQTLNEIKPMFMLAEDSSNYGLLKEAFNSNYNWSLLHAMEKSSDGSGNKARIKENIRNVESRYPYGTFPMNFVTNHDENSWNGSVFERFGASNNMMTALTFMLPGMPLIYSGQEASLNKRLLFFEKDQIDWSDLTNQDFLKKLIEIKKDNIALFNGSAGGTIDSISNSDRSILSFVRSKDNNRVLFLANFNKDKISFSLRGFKELGTYRDSLTNQIVEVEEGSELTLDGFGFKILVR